MEKNVMRSMELVGRERMEVAVSFPRQSAVVAEYSFIHTATTLNLGRGL